MKIFIVTVFGSFKSHKEATDIDKIVMNSNSIAIIENIHCNKIMQYAAIK